MLRRSWCAALLGALGLCAVGATAFAAPGNLTFDGRLTLNGKPAPGQEVLVVTGPELTILTLCGRATTDGNGHYSVTIDAREACTDRGNGGHAVPFIFTWQGQQVGQVTAHHDAERGKSDLIIENLNILVPLKLFTLQDMPQRTGSGKLVAHRYFGRVLVHGKAPATPMDVTAVTARGGYPCGRGSVVDGGRFYLDISSDAQCGSPPGGLGVALSFRIDGREVWHTTIDLVHELPTTLGKPSATPTLTADWRGR